MKTVTDLEKEIRIELSHESSLVATGIKISVDGDHVTLEGVADSYAKKIETERAALRVDGVKKVTNNIVLKIQNHRSDEDIKKTVVRMITWNSCIDESRISVTVDNGWVTLAGDVDYDYQKSKATFLTEDISGVSGVTNLINVVPALENINRKLSA